MLQLCRGKNFYSPDELNLSIAYDGPQGSNFQKMAACIEIKSCRYHISLYFWMAHLRMRLPIDKPCIYKYVLSCITKLKMETLHLAELKRLSNLRKNLLNTYKNGNWEVIF
jgi:hypothetical protein